jgi:hypothetical protein
MARPVVPARSDAQQHLRRGWLGDLPTGGASTVATGLDGTREVPRIVPASFEAVMRPQCGGRPEDRCL